MGFYRKFHGTLKANKLKDETTRKLLAQGIIHPESKRPLKHLLDHHKPFPREEAKQLAKDISEFGQGAAGAMLAQIA